MLLTWAWQDILMYRGKEKLNVVYVLSSTKDTVVGKSDQHRDFGSEETNLHSFFAFNQRLIQVHCTSPDSIKCNNFTYVTNLQGKFYIQVRNLGRFFFECIKKKKHKTCLKIKICRLSDTDGVKIHFRFISLNNTNNHLKALYTI